MDKRPIGIVVGKVFLDCSKNWISRTLIATSKKLPNCGPTGWLKSSRWSCMSVCKAD